MADAGVMDWTVKFDGCGYRFDVFVNSNEAPGEIAKRISRAARGQIKAACIVAVARLTPEEVAEAMAIGAEVARSGRGTEFDAG